MQYTVKHGVCMQYEVQCVVRHRGLSGSWRATQAQSGGAGGVVEVLEVLERGGGKGGCGALEGGSRGDQE